MELGMISSTWLDTKVGRLDGIRTAKQIGFDTYDIFEDPLDLTDADREEIKKTCEEVGLPIRSVVCVAFGIVDFNPSVRRFTLDRIKAYVDQGAFFGARNVLLVVGEYYWDCEVFPQARDLGHGQGHGQGGRRVRAVEGPRDRARARAVRRRRCSRTSTSSPASSTRSTTRPFARTPTSRTCISPDASFDDVKELTGLIGHIHLSDCDGKVHGDLPAGMGVTPIKEYLAAIRDTGYDGTVSIELEYSPDPDKIVEWAQQAYDGTAQIMSEIGVRG